MTKLYKTLNHTTKYLLLLTLFAAYCPTQLFGQTSQPNFTLSAATTCKNARVTVNNTSTFDNTCNNPVYRWDIFQEDGTTPATGVSYASGNLNATAPEFIFAIPGIYKIRLSITTNCGTALSVKSISVEDTPTATLSPNFSLCGKNYILTFDNNAEKTNTIFTGTPITDPLTTYTWTVTGSGSSKFQFVDNTTEHSQYPHILFKDHGIYTITVTHSNTCGNTISLQQQITFIEAPAVDAGLLPPVCENSGPVHLTGKIEGTYTSFNWLIDVPANNTAVGTLSSTTGSLTPTYTPSPQDIERGYVTIRLVVLANAGDCSRQSDGIVLTFLKAPKITSVDKKTICSGNKVNYNIIANEPTNFSWTATSTTATGFTSGSGSIINDLLINNNPTVTATVTYVITATNSNGCASKPFNFVVTIPAVPIATPTKDAPIICSAGPVNINLSSNQDPATTKYTWTYTGPGVTGGTVQTTPTQVNNNKIVDFLVNNTNAVVTVTYSITAYNANNCAGAPVDISIDVYPNTPAAIAGSDQAICNSTFIALNATAPPSPFNGNWVQPVGQNATITNPADPLTTVTNLVPGNIYTFTWVVSTPFPCDITRASVVITNNLATVGGTTAGADTVCAGSNTGVITLTGNVGNILRWESSVNGTAWTTIPGPNYNNLIQTTQFRAVVKNGVCSEEVSTVTTIKVNQPAPPAVAGNNQVLCNATIATLNATQPTGFIGQWTQTSGPPINITNSNDPHTTITNLTAGNVYTFRWTIIVDEPCVNTSAVVTVTNKADVVANFTSSAKVGCGDLTVRFTNTSDNQAGANFTWNFGDGQLSNVASPQHTFAQRTDGKDTTYYISLKVVDNCNDRPAIVDSILVRPAQPLASISPASTAGCGSYAIDIRNTSPGNNLSYVFYLYEGNTLLQTITKNDKTNAVFTAISTTVRKVFNVFMVTTGYCNNISETPHIPITISPSAITAQMAIQGGKNSGCAPLKINLINNSLNGDNFLYTIYDTNNNVIDKFQSSLTTLPYTFNTSGTYYVTLTAATNCSINESTRTRIDVSNSPTPNFVADITTGCKNILVAFTNNTVSNDPNSSAQSLIYDWDFGDGSPHSALFAPVHNYHFSGKPYTVTLRATNSLSGCSEVSIKTSYIVLSGPPKTAFAISPDSVTTIPNYTFSFIDQTTDAVSWRWTFGNGQTSTQRNPTITYPDTGVYRVTLTTTTATGCDSTITKTVRIGGIPGQLFLPNAFMPESAKPELRTFVAIGSGIKTWHLQIFSSGRLIWQTSKLNLKGEPDEGWDGTINGIPAPQGVYQWQASATFINGTEWKGNSYKSELPKRVGSVHLIR